MTIEENDIVLYYIQYEGTYLKSICRIDEINFLGGIVAEELYSLSELKLTDVYSTDRRTSIHRDKIRKNFGKLSLPTFLEKYPEYEL